MSNYYGVLIDTTSIQQYVFSGNRLKENLGASFLVQEIFKSILDGISVRYDKEGFIGGGNALLFFKEKNVAKEFLKEWTRNLLIETPGLTTAVAISKEIINEKDLNDKDKFPKFKKSLFRQLTENKNSFFPQVVLSSHGITADCRNTGYSVENWIDSIEDSGYYSSVSTSKLISESEAMKKLNDEFPVKNYIYTNDLEKLGSSRGEDSHIAIVHIDGNGMGKRFENCKTLDEIRDLSESLEKATKDSFKDLINHIAAKEDQIKNEIDIKSNIMPIRPIILGGDDITFVCDGRLGIYFAKLFLQAFETKEVSDKLPISACAGVAITKLKYPFYRGYKLSEELCANAKQKRKENDNSGSWIDFHIAYGGISADLKNIRDKFYNVAQGYLLLRPYNVSEDKEKNSFNKFVENTISLIKDFPKSKIKDLREVLYLGEESTKSFANQLKARELKFPEIQNYKFGENLFDEKITPYFDMIELTEIYPSFELKNQGANK
jgi:hypothetical protein